MMKHMHRFFQLLIVALVITSCKKTKEVRGVTSLNIINVAAVSPAPTLKFGSNATTIANNSYTLFSLVSGTNKLYVYPVGDSSHPYYNNTITTAGGIYSLFISNATDAVLIKDTIPYRKDSTFGVRFINMSPGSPALSINLKGKANGSEVSSLPYKSYTEFKTYNARINKSSDSTYAFVIRKAGTGDSLTTYTVAYTGGNFVTPRFQNITLVLRGIINGTPSFGVTKENNY